MTQKKQLKARVRARMARTGESYVTALRHVTSSSTDAPGNGARAGASVTAASGTGSAGSSGGAGGAGGAGGTGSSGGVGGSAVATERATSIGAQTPDIPVVDLGYALRGGLHPESANIAHVLAHYGITVAGRNGSVGSDTRSGSRAGAGTSGTGSRTGSTEADHTHLINEALVFGIGGGLGAGYILWEFKEHATATLVMAFQNSWQYPDKWHQKTLDRLGVRYVVEHTGGAAGAAKRLTELLQAGRPCIIRPDRYHMGYWRMPIYKEGHGGPDVVVYAQDADGGVHVDDRNVSPLIVPREKVDVARARVGSYKNSLYAIDPASGQVSADTLRAAVRTGLEDCVEHLSASSDSFSLPAWRKWARLMTDQKNAKAWPRVFANRQGGLAGTLLSIWEDILPAGGYGGHLRDLYADFLDQAAVLTENPALGEVAESFRSIGEAWHTVAETALPDGVPEFARLRDLTVAVRQGIVDPAAVSEEEADTAARDLWDLRAALDRDFPLDETRTNELFARLGAAVEAVYTHETAAIAQLAQAIGRK